MPSCKLYSPDLPSRSPSLQLRHTPGLARPAPGSAPRTEPALPRSSHPTRATTSIFTPPGTRAQKNSLRNISLHPKQGKSMTSTRAARHPRTWLHAPRRAAVGVHDHGGTQLGVARRSMLVGRGQGTQVSAERRGRRSAPVRSQTLATRSTRLASWHSSELPGAADAKSSRRSGKRPRGTEPRRGSRCAGLNASRTYLDSDAGKLRLS